MTEVYVIPKEKLHEWMGKRCLPPYPADADTLDCAALSQELVAEVEEMDLGKQFAEALSGVWNRVSDVWTETMPKLRAALEVKDPDDSQDR